MKIVEPTTYAKNSGLVLLQNRIMSSLLKQGSWLFLALLLTLAIIWVPYLVRSNAFTLPVLDNINSPLTTTGLYDTEKVNSEVLRWTKVQATIQLPTTLLPQEISLKLASGRTTGQPSPIVQILYNNQLINKAEVRISPKDYTLKIPSQWQWADGKLELKINSTLASSKGYEQGRGLEILGLSEVAERTPPLTVWLSVCLITLTLWLAAFRLFPIFNVSEFMPGRKMLGLVAFVNIPAVILSLYWNADRITAQAGLGWYVLVAVWLTLVLTWGPSIFPTPATNLNSVLWQLNGGLLTNSFKILEARYRSFSKTRLYFVRVGLPIVLITGLILWQYNLIFRQSYGFFWDDYHIARPWSISQLAGTWVGSWDPLQLEPAYYRPLTAASFALDYTMWGLNPFGYHLTNLLLETGVALLGYWLLYSNLGAKWLVSLVCITFFVLLPTSVATTVWISERSDSLALLFMLASLLAFRHFWQAGGNMKSSAYVGTNLALILALSCKETSVVLPEFLLFYAWAYSSRHFAKSQLVAFVPPFVITGLYLLWRTLVIQTVSQRPPTLQNLWQGYTEAVIQSLYGLDNLIANTKNRQNFDGLNTLLVVLLIVLVAGFLAWRGCQLFTDKPQLLARGWQLLFYGAGWLLISCAPLALLATTYGINSRVLYTPSFGYALMAGGIIWGVISFIKRATGGGRFWPLVIAALLCLWVVYTSVSTENLHIQKSYAPLDSETLHWDNWILQQPEWVSKIPVAQVNFLQKKLEQFTKQK